MSTPTLRLVTETERTPDSFKFEQRREPRHKLYARVTAVAENPAEEREERGPGQICALELTDQSASGLGAWSIEPVAIGARITVFFPAHGSEPGYNSVGRVVRCDASQGGYSIGLLLESQMAAA
ncbi:MAG: PilZ domain-containing protein [Planctomycetota bacterium]